MIIKNITTTPLRVPLLKPFVTALRTADAIENVLITIHTNEPGLTGYGEAAAIPQVTGETVAGINAAVLEYITPRLIGRSVLHFQSLTEEIDNAVHGNTSAKAGVETALYNLFAKSMGVPLYRLLGGDKDSLPENNLTVSAADIPEMIANCAEAKAAGFRHIKIKLGKTPATDYETLVKINEAINGEAVSGVSFRVDGNCGWTAKEAVQLIRRWEDAGIPIEWVEQPVKAWDITGLKHITQSTDTPIMADESCFNERDAVKILETRSADIINIKLAKAGGYDAWSPYR